MQHVTRCLTRVRTRLFSTSLPRYRDEPMVDEHKIRHIAQMLNLPESYVASKTIFRHPRVEQKIQYLLSNGCSQEQLRTGRFTYLKLSARKLEQLTAPTADSDGKPNVESILGDEFELYPDRNKNDKREEIAELLRVSESELTSRHFKQIKAKTLLPKIKLLLSYGVEPSEIFKAPYVLRHSSKNLEKACETLKQKGAQKLIVSEISIETHNKTRPSSEIITRLSYILGMSENKLMPFVSDITCSHKGMVPKVEFLIKEGFDPYGITEYLGQLSVHNLPIIAEAVADLQSIKGNDLQIEDVLHYVNKSTRGKVRLADQDKTCSRLAKLLNIPKEKLKIKYFHRRAHQTTLELRDKIGILEKYGFKIDAIKKCPIVLLHDANILEFCLKSLPSIPEIQPYEEWIMDQDKLIQVLEYSIERGLKDHES